MKPWKPKSTTPWMKGLLLNAASASTWMSRFPCADFRWKSAQELEGEHGGRKMAFATPDQE